MRMIVLTLTMFLCHGSLAHAMPDGAGAPKAPMRERAAARMKQASAATKKVGNRFGRRVTRTALVLGGGALVAAGIYQGPSPTGVACIATGCNMIALGTSKKAGFWRRVGIGGAITATTSWFGGQAVGSLVQGASPMLKIGSGVLSAGGGAALGRVAGTVSKERLLKVVAPIVEPIKRRVVKPLASQLEKLADRVGF